MLQAILDAPDRYLLAAPRIDLIEEHAEYLAVQARDRGIAVIIEAVHSGGARHPNTGRRIADACEKLSGVMHAVVLITHEALRGIDLTPFTRQPQPWHARIDEVPDALASGSFAAPAAAGYLASAYALEPTEAQGWWRAKLKPDAPGPGALGRDTYLRDLIPFDKRARAVHGGALVDVGDWRDATLPGRTVGWYAAWTPSALCGFASVEIAGANFETSLCGLVSSRLDGPELTYEYRRLSADRTTRPHVHIRYFTRAHVGSTAWWATGEGKRCLNAVVRHLMTVPDLGYLSGNSSVLSYAEGWLDHVTAVAPKQAGTNSLIAHTSCALIYSAKSQPSDAAIRVALGLTATDIERARETEDVLQFAMRGAIRNPAFAGEYVVYLYDEAQARALAHYIFESSITTDVIIEGVEGAGILEVVRPAPISQTVAVAETDGETFETRRTKRLGVDAERKRRQRAEEKAKRLAEGTYRPRGRPKRKNDVGQSTTDGV